MNKYLAIALVIAVALLALVTLKLFDAGMVVDNARVETKVQMDTAALLRSLLKHSTQGRSREDVLRLFVDDLPGDHIVHNDENQIDIGGVIFVLKDGRVVNVRLINEQ